MARLIDTLRLTAEEATSLLERGELSGAELRAAYLDAIEERDGELHCFLRTTMDANGEGVPIALSCSVNLSISSSASSSRASRATWRTSSRVIAIKPILPKRKAGLSARL